MERYNFNCREQGPKENFYVYLTTLCYLCNFYKCFWGTLLRDRIVMGIWSEETTKTLLNLQDLTLDKCIDNCRTDRATSLQLKHVSASGRTEEIDGFKSHKLKERKKSKGQPQDCIFCFSSHICGKKNCPAWGERCSVCNRLNHFDNPILSRYQEVFGKDVSVSSTATFHVDTTVTTMI